MPKTPRRNFQRISPKSRSLHNLTQPGKALRHFLRSDTAMSILEKHRCGWLDGGCWSLAAGLSLWIGQEASIGHVYNTETGRPEHAVCHIPCADIYIDGDGIATEADMIGKMIILEDYDLGALAIRKATPEENDPSRCWAKTAQTIHGLLMKTFGQWHRSHIRQQIMQLPRTGHVTMNAKPGQNGMHPPIHQQQKEAA